MRQAIVTKYHGPTDRRGSRVSATADAGRIFVSWDDSLGIEKNHDNAARLLAEKFKWRGTWYGGGLPTGDGNVYVCDDGASFHVADAARVTKTKKKRKRDDC